MAPERLTQANDAVVSAVARGFIRVRRRESGFRALSRASKPPGWEHPMAEYSGKITPTGLVGGPPQPTYIPEAMGPVAQRRNAVPPTEYPTDEESLSRGEPIFLFVAKQAPEPVAQHVEEDREKLTEATAEYFATVIVDPTFTAATQAWGTETDLVTEGVDGIEGVSERLKDGVAEPLKSFGTKPGLSPGAADFTAGIATNLILAPITGPLDKAATYIEVAGIIIGVTMGAHGLALACAKLLLKRQSERAFEQGVISLLHGPRTTQPQSDSQAAARRKPDTGADSLHFTRHEGVAQPVTHRAGHPSVVHAAPHDATETQWEPTPNDPLWLCLAFVPKPPASSRAAHTPTTTAATERDVTKPIVLPPGDDAFLRTLPEALRGGSVSEVDAQTLETMNDLPAGQHFIVQMEGISFGTSGAKSSSQATLQHPGCLTGRCVPPDQPPCLCPCNVCCP